MFKHDIHDLLDMLPDNYNDFPETDLERYELPDLTL